MKDRVMLGDKIFGPRRPPGWWAPPAWAAWVTILFWIPGCGEPPRPTSPTGEPAAPTSSPASIASGSTQPAAPVPPPPVSPFRVGEVLTCLERDGLVGCVDWGKQEVVPFVYADAAFHPAAPFLFLRKPGATWEIHEARTGLLWGTERDYSKFADNDLQRAMQHSTTSGEIIPSGLFVFHGKHGVINPVGEILVPPVFDSLGTGSSYVFLGVHESGKPVLLPAQQGDQHGAVNENGEIVIPLQYDEVRHHHPRSHILFLRAGAKWQIAHGITGQIALPHLFDEVETTNPYQGTFTAKVNGLEGRIDVKTLSVVIPFNYRKLGFEAYNGEIGWYRASNIFYGMIGTLCDNNKWAVMNTSLQLVTDCQYDRVLFDGYFFRGYTNPLGGMADCRSDAAKKGVQIAGFAVNSDTAVGYVDTSQKFHLLAPPLP